MNDELYHYGRKGMKWGQHIYGDPTHRRIKKLNKLSRRSDEQRAQSALSEDLSDYYSGDKTINGRMNRTRFANDAVRLNRMADKNRHKVDNMIKQLEDSGVQLIELRSYSESSLIKRWMHDRAVIPWSVEYDARVYARKKES